MLEFLVISVRVFVLTYHVISPIGEVFFDFVPTPEQLCWQLVATVWLFVSSEELVGARLARDGRTHLLPLALAVWLAALLALILALWFADISQLIHYCCPDEPRSCDQMVLNLGLACGGGVAIGIICYFSQQPTWSRIFLAVPVCSLLLLIPVGMQAQAYLQMHRSPCPSAWHPGPLTVPAALVVLGLGGHLLARGARVAGYSPEAIRQVPLIVGIWAYACLASLCLAVQVYLWDFVLYAVTDAHVDAERTALHWSKMFFFCLWAVIVCVQMCRYVRSRHAPGLRLTGSPWPRSCIATILILLGLAGWLPTCPRTPLPRSAPFHPSRSFNVQGIEPGMTLRQVLQIQGNPDAVEGQGDILATGHTYPRLLVVLSSANVVTRVIGTDLRQQETPIMSEGIPLPHLLERFGVRAARYPHVLVYCFGATRVLVHVERLVTRQGEGRYRVDRFGIELASEPLHEWPEALWKVTDGSPGDRRLQGQESTPNDAEPAEHELGVRPRRWRRGAGSDLRSNGRGHPKTCGPCFQPSSFVPYAWIQAVCQASSTTCRGTRTRPSKRRRQVVTTPADATVPSCTRSRRGRVPPGCSTVTCGGTLVARRWTTVPGRHAAPATQMAPVMACAVWHL